MPYFHTQHDLMRTYLRLYSIVSLWCWILFLGYFAYDPGFNSKILWLLTLAVGLSGLDIVHIRLSWAKGKVKPTVIRLCIHMFIIMLLHLMGSSPRVQLAIDGRIIIAVAWSFTEIIRHWHALRELKGKQGEGLTWLRYSGYILFYPISFIGELLIAYQFMAERSFKMDVYGIICILLICGFLVGYPFLFQFMGKQRRRKLRPKV